MFSVIDIAEALGYNKIDRLRHFEEGRQEELHSVVRASSREALTILFFPGKFYEIRHDRLGVHMFYSKGVNATQNYLISHPEMNEKFLRKVFTGIELLLYKICHVILEKQNRKYSFESQKTISRFNRVKESLTVGNKDEYKFLFLEIMTSRDYFAHSFVEIDQIPYRGVPISICFGHRTNFYQRNISHVKPNFTFIEDLTTVLNPLTELFIAHQFEQIDKDKFFKLCDHLLKEKSLIV